MTFWEDYDKTGGRGLPPGSGYLTNIKTSRIYIGSNTSGRFVDLPAFIDDIKYSVDRESEVVSEVDKQGGHYIQRSGTVNLELSLNVPASSATEAKHNLARVGEIMRMISTNVSPPEAAGALGSFGGFNFAKVFIKFANLISRGGFEDTDKIENFSDLKTFGLPGFIKEFDYTPDIEVGFFIDSQYRAPKNIKVKISLLVDAAPAQYYFDTGGPNEKKKVPGFPSLDAAYPRWVVRGLCNSGEFTAGDNGGWPFGIKIIDSRKTACAKTDRNCYTFEELNERSADRYTNRVGSYFMIGNWYSEQIPEKRRFNTSFSKVFGDQISESYKTPAYCSFKMFLEDFKLSKRTKLENDKISGSDVGVFFSNFSDENTEFDIKFSVISSNLEEAKRNCGKIQILLRLLFSENYLRLIKDKKDRLLTANYVIHDQTRRRIYVPNLIEGPWSTKQGPVYEGVEKAYSGFMSTPSLLKNNGVGCELLSMDVNIVNDLGFFIDDGNTLPEQTKPGKLKYYPKGFNISINAAIIGIDENYSGFPKNYDSSGEKLQDPRDYRDFPFKFK